MFCLCVGAWLHMSCFVDDVMLLRSRLCLCGVYMISSCPCTHFGSRTRTTSSGPQSFRAFILLGADRLRLSSRRSHRPSKKTVPPSPSPFLSGPVGIIVTCLAEADCWICYIVLVTRQSVSDLLPPTRPSLHILLSR